MLPCTTILEDDRIVVVMSIPLLDFTGQYDVIKVHNIPLPMHEAQTKSPSQSIPTMVAMYDIEYPGLLINKDGNRYTLLSENEIVACSSHEILQSTECNTASQFKQALRLSFVLQERRSG